MQMFSKSGLRNSIKIKGELGGVIDRFLVNRQISDFAKTEIYKESYEVFKKRNDENEKVGSGMWKGEFWGKFMLSAVDTARYYNDVEYTEFLHKQTLKFLKTQDEDGYIGTYKNQLSVFEHPERENWVETINWNIWGRKYTLWALLEVYKLVEDKYILEKTVKFADNLIDKLEENNIHICETGCFGGLASGSILKPMLILYEITDDRKYLDFSMKIADFWENPDNRICLIANFLNKKPVHEWYPNPERWAKAYEMLSCLEGILKLFEITRIEKYLECVKNAYELLENYERNPMGSLGFVDKFHFAAEIINGMVEPCDIIHWNRFLLRLWMHTGDEVLADNYENAFYNGILTSIDDSLKWGYRRIRSSHFHLVANPQCGLKYHQCCMDNMPRALIEFSKFAVTVKDKSIYINAFESISAQIGDTKIDIGGTYLYDGNVSIDIDNGGKNKIYIRIPSFSRKAIITVDSNDAIVIEQSGYFEVGDCKVKKVSISFDLNPRFVSPVSVDYCLPKSHEKNQKWRQYGKENYKNTETAIISEDEIYDTKQIVVFYGPLLLAKDTRISCKRDEMFKADRIDIEKGVKIFPLKAGKGIKRMYEAKMITPEGKLKKVKLCDYASAGKSKNILKFDYINEKFDGLNGDSPSFTIYI